MHWIYKYLLGIVITAKKFCKCDVRTGLLLSSLLTYLLTTAIPTTCHYLADKKVIKIDQSHYSDKTGHMYMYGFFLIYPHIASSPSVDVCCTKIKTFQRDWLLIAVCVFPAWSLRYCVNREASGINMLLNCGSAGSPWHASGDSWQSLILYGDYR